MSDGFPVVRCVLSAVTVGLGHRRTHQLNLKGRVGVGVSTSTPTYRGNQARRTVLGKSVDPISLISTHRIGMFGQLLEGREPGFRLTHYDTLRSNGF